VIVAVDHHLPHALQGTGPEVPGKYRAVLELQGTKRVPHGLHLARGRAVVAAVAGLDVLPVAVAKLVIVSEPDAGSCRPLASHWARKRS